MLMRLIVRFSKEERVKYISHLDLMRTMQRALRRAEIPVAFSQGFNPHPRLSFASALAVGMTSECEYMDILLEKPISPEEFCSRMNKALPSGIRILEGKVVSDKIPSLMSVIERADYLIEIHDIDPNFTSNDKLDEFLAQEEIIVETKGKKGIRNVNIRDMIYQMEWVIDKTGNPLLKVGISTGSKKNLKPDILTKTFFSWIGASIKEREPLRIHRVNMYLLQGSRWITPMEIE